MVSSSGRGRRARALTWRSTFSTITTEPSTSIPKSSAPSERRFAGTWVASRRIEAKRSANGIVAATISALRTLPRNKKSTPVTSSIPSARLWSTVCVV